MIHFAAGILPITWHEGVPLLLVGKDIRDNQSWSDFGGKAERIDRNDPIACAVREFYEETYGAVMCQKAMRLRMHSDTSILLRSHTQNGYPYFCYVVEVPFMPHLRNAFGKTLAFLRSKNLRMYIEKTDVQWTTWAMLQELLKRQVFANTLETHRPFFETLERSTPDEWRALCAQHAARFDVRPLGLGGGAATAM